MTQLKDIIERRGRRAVIATQQQAWLQFGIALASDPAFRAEVAQARAGQQAPIVRDTALITRACTAGALDRAEAVTLFKRVQGA